MCKIYKKKRENESEIKTFLFKATKKKKSRFFR